MEDILIECSKWTLVCAGFLAVVRVMIGPLNLDRALGLEVFTLASMAIVILHGASTSTNHYYDLLIIWALIAFVGTAALGRYLYSNHEKES